MEETQDILVLLQAFPDGLHPISKKIITTARQLGKTGGYPVHGVLFCSHLTDPVTQELRETGLDEVLVLEDPAYGAFIPEQQAQALSRLAQEKTQVVLVPATPEGRTVSSMLAARLHTGVTADCTALSFTAEDLLLQTRPAFSGNIMADIVTRTARPQIASLRFASPVEPPTKETPILRQKAVDPVSAAYETQWLDQACGSASQADEILLAVGGGLREKADLELFRNLAEKLGAKLCCSRVLVDRGWLSRKEQIGLSGQSVSPKLLITFGISGSLQFRAGLEEVGCLCAVNTDVHAPLLQMADVPVVGDLYEIAQEMLHQLGD